MLNRRSTQLTIRGLIAFIVAYYAVTNYILPKENMQSPKTMFVVISLTLGLILLDQRINSEGFEEDDQAMQDMQDSLEPPKPKDPIVGGVAMPSQYTPEQQKEEQEPLTAEALLRKRERLAASCRLANEAMSELPAGIDYNKLMSNPDPALLNALTPEQKRKLCDKVQRTFGGVCAFNKKKNDGMLYDAHGNPVMLKKNVKKAPTPMPQGCPFVYPTEDAYDDSYDA